MGLNLGVIAAMAAAVLLSAQTGAVEGAEKSSVQGPNAALLEPVRRADSISVQIIPSGIAFGVAPPEDAFSPARSDYVVHGSAVAPFLALLDQGILLHRPGRKPVYENRAAIFFQRDGVTIGKIFMGDTSPYGFGYFNGEALVVSAGLPQQLRDFSTQPGVDVHTREAARPISPPIRIPERAKSSDQESTEALLKAVREADNISVQIISKDAKFRNRLGEEAFLPNQCDYIVRGPVVSSFFTLLENEILVHIQGPKPGYETRAAIFFRHGGTTIGKLFISEDDPFNWGYFNGEALIAAGLPQKLRDFSSLPGVEVHEPSAMDC